MTITDLSKALNYNIDMTDLEDREVTSVYCCDLLSLVMGRAPADSAWVTVMGNINSVAVAVLADVSCIILAEGSILDEEATKKAKEQGVAVIKTELPVFEAAKVAYDIIG